MSLLDDITSNLKAGGCGVNEALEQLQAAEDELNAAIDGAMADINGAIADIQAKVDEAQAKLNDAIGDALGEVRTLQSDVEKLIKDALNPLLSGSDAFAEKLAEFREHYATAVEDIDELMATVSGFINDPLVCWYQIKLSGKFSEVVVCTIGFEYSSLSTFEDLRTAGRTCLIDVLPLVSG